MLSTPLGRLKVIGTIEAISFLLLVLVAMPLKYLAGRPEAVKIVGSVHGALWILYLLALALAWKSERWPFKVAFYGGAASVLPFGPFVFDSYLAKLSASQAEA